jgi:Rad3-related DNA helicase
MQSSYLLADTLNLAENRLPLIPNYQNIIIDEAHKLEQAAQSIYGMEFINTCTAKIKDSIDRLVFRKNCNGVEAGKLAKKLNDKNINLFTE